MLIYAYNIVLIANYSIELQRHLDTLNAFAKDRGLAMILMKIKIMIFTSTTHSCQDPHPGPLMYKR